eukprot:TRINITY_DN1340_c0_g1_i4.p1 TRINITY_DN1340_c0_g1~~TRINITY_DN1340_c0_g1_i4.p1  ORF type:complete len:369 (-),score=66.80 TRINITY_DN1340_c0_g1_i4:21-1127(-)
MEAPWVLSLLNGYRQMVNPITLINRFESELVSPSSQQTIYSKILMDDLVTKYPPSHAYIHLFLKTWVQKIERSKEEINEDVLSYYLKIIESKDTQSEEEICYKSYPFDDLNDQDKWLTVRVLSKYNQVGLTTWPACFLLCSFILANPDLFDGRNCLELGSGTGLPSMVLCRTCKAQKVVVSDYVPVVIQNLVKSLVLNGMHLEKISTDQEHLLSGCPKIESVARKSEDYREFEWWCSGKLDNTEMDVISLDWEILTTHSTTETFLQTVDTIIAADILYDTRTIPSLVNTLKSFLFNPNKKVTAYIASTIRKQDTFSFFKEQLETLDLCYEDITEKARLPFQLFEYDPSNIVLYQISTKLKPQKTWNSK